MRTTAGYLVEELDGLSLDAIEGAEEQRAIEVALRTAAHVEDLGQVAPPVHAEHIAGHVLEQVLRAGAEVDRGHRERAQDPVRVRGYELAVVRDRERAD